MSTALHLDRTATRPRRIGPAFTAGVADRVLDVVLIVAAVLHAAT